MLSPKAKPNYFKNPFFWAAIILAGVVVSIWKWGILEIKQVKVVTEEISCATVDQLKGQLNLAGQNIFLVDDKKIEKVKNRYPCIAEITFNRQLPNTVQLTAKGRKAVARVDNYQRVLPLDLKALESSSSSSSALLDWSVPNISKKEFFLVDNTGFIFEKSGGGNLPLLFLPEEKIEIGQQLDQSSFGKISPVLVRLSSLEFPATASANLPEFDAHQITAKIDGPYLIFPKPRKMAFSLDRDIFKQLASLQLILQKAKIEGKKMELIDLRFDNPVVIYTNGQR